MLQNLVGVKTACTAANEFVKLQQELRAAKTLRCCQFKDSLSALIVSIGEAQEGVIARAV